MLPTKTLPRNTRGSASKRLEGNGYVIPPEIAPIIDAYVAEGAPFIALRLKPGAGVRQMTPVRVVTPGASPILPLRMVAAGTGTTTSIVLYVIAEGRYAPQDKKTAAIDFPRLTWDWAASSSNYSFLRDQALDGGGYLTSFAHPKGFTAQVMTPESTPARYDVLDAETGFEESYDNLTDLYFAQASSNENMPNGCGGVGSFLRSLKDGDAIAPKCEEPAGCEAPSEGTFTSDALECSAFSDIAAALVGMHPTDVWVTRLEANLPRSELSSDLTLAATPSQAKVANWHVAPQSANPPCVSGQSSANADDVDVESDWGGCGCATRKPLTPSAALGGTTFAGLLLALRRVARRTRRQSRNSRL